MKRIISAVAAVTAVTAVTTLGLSASSGEARS